VYSAGESALKGHSKHGKEQISKAKAKGIYMRGDANIDPPCGPVANSAGAHWPNTRNDGNAKERTKRALDGQSLLTGALVF